MLLIPDITIFYSLQAVCQTFFDAVSHSLPDFTKTAHALSIHTVMKIKILTC